MQAGSYNNLTLHSGERNSGTTFVSDTLAEAFDPPNFMGSKLERFSSGIPVLLHKHMFRHDLLNETELTEIKARTDILWVLVVRSPCDWCVIMLTICECFIRSKHDTLPHVHVAQ